MTYRLSDRFETDADMERWVDRQNEYGDAMVNWFGGIAVGVIVTLVGLWVVGVL